MKKLILLFLIGNACLAQGFIEIEVRDTLVMKPVGFVYEVSLADNYDYEAIVDSSSAYEPEIEAAKERANKKNAETRTINELENFLKKHKYAYEPSKNYDIGNAYGYGNKSNKSYLVKVKTAEALDKLAKEIEKMENFTGSISDIDYGNPEKLEGKLLDKLLKKAKAKAVVISGLTSQKLGAIVEFRELKQSDNLNYTVTDLILNTRKKSPRDFFKQGLDGELAKAVVVKFKTE